MPHEWITDRLPTEADADGDGDVRVPRRHAGAPGERWWYQHYSLIVPGQPWWSPRVPERVEVEPVAAPALSFAVGQLWRRRNGEVVRVTQVDPGDDLPVCVDNGYWHRADGTSCLSRSEHDLIELVSGSEPAPTRKVVQIAAASAELYALCDDDTMWILGHPGWTQLPAIPQPEA
jgi:hypothetical protein